MSNQLSDIQIVQKYFNVDEAKAQGMINKGLNVEYLRSGLIGTEKERLTDKYKDIVDGIVEDEFSDD